MIKSGCLEDVCNEMSDMPADVDGIRSRLKGKHRKNVYEAGRIHLRLCLENLSEEYPIVLDPIKNMEKRGHLIYLVRDSVVVRARCDGRKLCGVDQVVLVDGLPVLFDAKISRYRTGGRAGIESSQQRKIRKGKRRWGFGIIQSFMSNVIEKKLSPFKRYFGQDIGYAVLVPNDETSPCLSPTSYMSWFVRNSGVIVPLYTDRERFKTEILCYQIPQTE